MGLFTIIAILISLTAILSFLNERYAGLPTPIGVTIGGLATSLVLVGLERLHVIEPGLIAGLLTGIDFDELLMHGILGALLFAGSLELDLSSLLDRKWSILLLATLGVMISTLVVGTLVWLLLGAIGWAIPFGYAILFGALISPTDPIAVLALLKRVGAPKELEVMIGGESLFNDGVGVVVFTLIFGLLFGGHDVTFSGIGWLFLQEAIGGAIYGLVLGYVAYLMLRQVDAYAVEILVTLAVVTGGYALAFTLHVSGPIAMVVAGLFIGNRGRLLAMSKKTREHLDTFWVVVDEVLNALLFLIIGLEVLVLQRQSMPVDLVVIAALSVILIVILGRFVAVSIPITMLRFKRSFPPRTIRILTWGGLRGGIAIALALSIPVSTERHLIVALTYAVVVFSILIQGMTVEKLIRRNVARSESASQD